WATAIVLLMDSYTEVSPSGTGLKIFVLGTLLEGAKQGKIYKLEIYDQKRYFTVTGHHLAASPLTIESREDRLRMYADAAWSRDLRKLVKLFGFFISETADWINIRCPWAANHSTPDAERDAGLYVKDGQITGFKCFHAGCTEKTLGDVWKIFGIKGG